MPFFARQKTIWPLPLVMKHREESITDEGFVVEHKVPDNHPLPDIALFDLERQIKAGVNQQQVSTKILGSQYAVADIVDAFSTLATNKDE